MPEVPRYEQTEDLDHETSPEGASPWLVAAACREIIEGAGLDPRDEDMTEAPTMIVNAGSPEEAITTAVSTFEGLGIRYEKFFVLPTEKDIIEDSK